MRSWVRWLIFFAVAAVPLWKCLLMGQTIGPWEHIRPMAGLPAPTASSPWDVLQADGALQFYPWRDLVFHSWQHLSAPYYNPYQLAGMPLLANSQSGGFYPLHILVGILHLPTGFGLTLLALLHLALAAAGVDRLARRFGAHPMGAMMGGISFALSPFMLGWTALASVISTVAWIPWVLFWVTQLVGPGEERPPTRPTMVWLAACTGMMVLAGHLQFVAYGFLAVAILAVCLAIGSRPGWGRGLAVVGGLVLGLMLAAPQLLPVLEYSKHSHRANTPDAVGFAGYQSSAIQPWEIGNIVNPMTLGNPREFAGDSGFSTYWPGRVKRGGNWTESAIAPGAVVIACLCFLPLVWRRVSGAWPFLLIALVGLLIAFGTPLNSVLYFRVPKWSSTGSPGRAIVLFTLCACVLAALVVGNLFHRREADGTHPPFSMRAMQLSILVFALVAFGSFALGQRGADLQPDVNPEAFKAIVGLATANALILTLIIAFLSVQPLIFTYFQSRIKPGRDITWIFPVAAVLVALVGGAQTIVQTGEAIPGPGDFVARNSRVAYPNDDWGISMVAKATNPPNLATIARECDVSGYDSLLHKDLQLWLSGIDGGPGVDPSPPANGNMMFVKKSADPAKLAAAGVNSSRTEFRPLGEVGPAEITEQTLSSVTVKVGGAGELTLKDHNLGGWSARTIDGKSLDLKESPWLSVDVPEGATGVVFNYRPPGSNIGFLFFVTALAILIPSALYKVRPRPLTAALAAEPVEEETAA